MSHVAPTDTPNVVIESPTVRKGLGAALYIVSVLTGLASIITIAYPDVAGFDVPKLITVINAAISFLTGAFGLVVTLPNVPKR